MGRGAGSAFHEFQSREDEQRLPHITQALNGVRRRPPLPRHSISDLGPSSIARIASLEPPVASIPGCVPPPVHAGMRLSCTATDLSCMTNALVRCVQAGNLQPSTGTLQPTPT